jgi:hypothetical protein
MALVCVGEREMERVGKRYGRVGEGIEERPPEVV